MCSSGPVTCVTAPVAANVLQDRHIFGRQQAVFPDIPLHLDIVLVARVYFDDGRSERAGGSVGHDDTDNQRSELSDSVNLNSQGAVLMSPRTSMETKAGVPEDNLTLVAWTFLPLIVRGKTELYHALTIFFDVNT